MESKALAQDVSQEELDAFVQVVVLVAFADGDLSDSEEKILVDNVKRLTGDRVDVDQLRSLMVELPPLSRNSKNWRADRLALLKKQMPSEEMRNEAFRIAVEVARSDARIGLREGRMLVNIVAELEIDPAYAQAVLKES